MLDLVSFSIATYFSKLIVSGTGPSSACLRLLDENRIVVYVTRATLKELRKVCAYPAIRKRSPTLTDQHVASFLQRLSLKATLIRQVRHAIDYPRAVQDEPYIDLSFTIRADYLVTRDKDLLSLMTGHSLVCKEFRQKTHPLQVLDPVSFLAHFED